MKLVVGLGNPGRKYEGTRHNVGFEVLRELASRQGVTPREKFHGDWLETSWGTERVGLLMPRTYMNVSGKSVHAAVEFFRVELAELLVVSDDFHLDLGRLRIRRTGSAGGQKGLADIIRQLGTDQFARLRIGSGSPPATWDPADFVLSRFTEHERPSMQASIQAAADAVVVWIQEGVEAAMNRYNSEPA
ncbi:MAG TPA: aminoacyl-tRNA hydrolase [Pirellulaceae bacterium]